MHSVGFAASGLDYAYGTLDVPPEKPAKAVDGLVVLGCVGFDVTMPHKEKITPPLDGVDEIAMVSGAVNTVEIRDGALRERTPTGAALWKPAPKPA